VDQAVVDQVVFGAQLGVLAALDVLIRDDDTAPADVFETAVGERAVMDAIASEDRVIADVPEVALFDIDVMGKAHEHCRG